MASNTELLQSSPSSHSLCSSILGFINVGEHQPKMSYKWAICERSIRLVTVPSDNGEIILAERIWIIVPLYAKDFGENVGASDLEWSFLVQQVRGNVLSDGWFTSFPFMEHEPSKCE